MYIYTLYDIDIQRYILITTRFFTYRTASNINIKHLHITTNSTHNIYNNINTFHEAFPVNIEHIKSKKKKQKKFLM